MPVISRFFGMIIKMYFRQSEHNPPHIHVIYGEYVGLIDIQTFEMFEGDLPSRALSLVKEWMSLHKDELVQIWNTQNFVELPPLE
ncbi:MAG: DUF4160 domain-containing protein [Spirochaetaceae bacterium]|nr:DUF4160 domain-containing protein [Spirochaetaceae bacterium]